MTSEVFNIDCLEYMRTLPDKAFQLAIADPPYGIGADKPAKKPGMIRQKNGSYLPATLNDYGKKDWDAAIPPQEFFDELRRISRHQIIWGANYFGLAGGMIVWDKMNGDSDQYGCEIAYQSFNQRTDIVHYMWQCMFQGECCSTDVNIANRQQGNKQLNEKRIHPTQKPVALYAWLLKNYAKPGDRIFDPMMGSQSSRIAAYKMGFDYVGCELDKEYFDKGCERFNRECKGEIVTKDGGIIIEELHNKLLAAEDRIVGLKNERQQLADKIGKNYLAEILRVVNMIKEGMTEKKAKLAKVDSALTSIESILQRVNE